MLKLKSFEDDHIWQNVLWNKGVRPAEMKINDYSGKDTFVAAV